jgi:nitrate reductase alpha subunit
MIILGAGHWYHWYELPGMININVLASCVGQSGGGWSHYVGGAASAGWLPLAFALDWNRPPRQMNSTSFFTIWRQPSMTRTCRRRCARWPMPANWPSDRL